MLLSAIVAVGSQGEIGQGGSLPWPKLAADMKWFAEKTRGKGVIMGHETWKSLPVRPLPGRVNVVMTRNMFADGPWWRAWDANPPTVTPPAEVFATDGRMSAIGLARRGGGEEAVVIGGAQIYREFWPLIRRLYVTRISATFPDADTALDLPLPPPGWRERDARGEAVDAGLRLTFHVYEATDARGG